MDIKSLREEFSHVHKAANDQLTKIASEGRQATAEEKASQDARFARMDEIKAMVEQSSRLAELAFSRGEAEEQNSRAEHEFKKHTAEARKLTAVDEANLFLRHGNELGHKFTLITTSGSSVMLPKEVMAPYVVRRNINAFRAAIARQGVSPLETTDTAQVTLPVFDDTAAIGEAPAENASAETAPVDSTVSGSLTLNAVLYSSKNKWFSNTLLNANGFDILGYVAPILQKKLDKAQESAWTTTAKALATGYTTAAPTAISYADLLGWEHSLSVAYRSDAAFVISDSLYKAFRGLVDGNGRPIMDLDPQNSFQASIHGKPVVVSDYFDAANTATNKIGMFVSADAIKIRDVVPQRLTRYVNVPSYPDQTGFGLFANGDCQFVAAGASLLVQHA